MRVICIFTKALNIYFILKIRSCIINQNFYVLCCLFDGNKAPLSFDFHYYLSQRHFHLPFYQEHYLSWFLANKSFW